MGRKPPFTSGGLRPGAAARTSLAAGFGLDSHFRAGAPTDHVAGNRQSERVSGSWRVHPDLLLSGGALARGARVA